MGAQSAGIDASRVQFVNASLSPDLLTVDAEWPFDVDPILHDGETVDFFIEVSGPPVSQEGPRASIALIVRGSNFGIGPLSSVIIDCSRCANRRRRLAEDYFGGDFAQLNFDSANNRWGVFAMGRSTLLTDANLGKADKVVIGGRYEGVEDHAVGPFVHQNAMIFKQSTGIFEVFDPLDDRKEALHGSTLILDFLTEYFSDSGTLTNFVVCVDPFC